MQSVFGELAYKYGGEAAAVGTGTYAPADSYKATVSRMFGSGRYDFNGDGYSERNKSQWTMPEAVRGESAEMAVRMESWSLLMDSFYTSDDGLLPLVKTSKLKIEIKKYLFPPSLAQPWAEKGRVRDQVSKESTIRDVLEPMAVGFSMSMDVLTEAFGEMIYLAKIKQALLSVQETNNLRVISAILRVWKPAQDFQRRYKRMAGRPVRDLLKRVYEFIDIVRKDPSPMETIDTIVSTEQRLIRGRGDT